MKAVKLLILVALLWMSNQISGAPGCKDHKGLYVAHFQKALIGHTFLSRPRTTRVQCMMLCSRHGRCLSFNHEDASDTCQLNSERKEEFPESLYRDVGFSYFGGLKPRAQGFQDITTVDGQLSTNSSHVTSTSPSTACNCCDPLGMESGAILDHQISAGSVLNDSATYGPAFARLNSQSAWCGDWLTAEIWIQVTFYQTVSFYGLIIQGLPIPGWYIITFTLSFDTEANWDEPREREQFECYEVVKEDALVKLPHVVRSTFIRIHPTGGSIVGCMRFEILGCQ